MLPKLQHNQEEIISLYSRHRETVHLLETFLHDEAIGKLASELHLNDADMDAALEWISDYGSIFRMLKKHRFDLNVTKDTLARTLRWRINQMSTMKYSEDPGSRPNSLSPSAFIYSLPPRAHDAFGRPVVVLQAGKLLDTEQSKRDIIRVYEDMRRRLRAAHNDDEEASDEPTLQFVTIIDCKGVSMRSRAVDLISWFIKEVAPHFPGMCAALFVLNYSWGYGMYNIVKRLLPSSVLSRIHFPNQSELFECFDKDCVPLEYGGALDFSSYNTISATSSLSSDLPLDTHTEETQSDPSPRRSNSNLSYLLLPTMSAFNPYFGYPVVSSPGSSVPHLKNGRRRKRDLAQTLFRLWLLKMKKWTDKTWLWVVMSIIFWVIGLKESQ
ncbi:hypothetical protein M422DRAFT_27726 [Sphaerobolus stellatus SS14]|nr:hypothetical protein M422DRAFT_27726 [Sphaerobolus stellatus SS14]